VTAILRASNLSKSFGGIHAVKSVDFELRQGEILGLIGPNGAGKSTLFNILDGVYKPDKGTVHFKETEIGGMKPHAICNLGVARTFQIVKPFPTLTVMQNIMVGARFGKNKNFWSRQNYSHRALQCLDFVGMSGKKDFLLENMNLGAIKRVELARALATKPEVLLLDEVIAGLNVVETEEMMGLIQRIREELKMSVLMIEHIMKAIMGISDRVIVLHHGELIAEGNPGEIVQNPMVIEAYLGERPVTK
jgi:branched-chain amino acid transport system ATP-binding protein